MSEATDNFNQKVSDLLFGLRDDCDQYGLLHQSPDSDISHLNNNDPMNYLNGADKKLMELINLLPSGKSKIIPKCPPGVTPDNNLLAINTYSQWALINWGNGNSDDVYDNLSCLMWLLVQERLHH